MRVTVRGGGPPRCLASSRTAANRDVARSNSHGIHPRNAGTSDGERGRRMTTIVVSGSTRTSTVSTSVPSGTSYIVSAGGTLDVVSGGIASGLVTISPGGTEHISSGGLVLNTSIGGGSAFGTGLQFIFSGGTASNTVVLQDGCNDPSFQIVSSGGLAVNTVLSAGDELGVRRRDRKPHHGSQPRLASPFRRHRRQHERPRQRNAKCVFRLASRSTPR